MFNRELRYATKLTTAGNFGGNAVTITASNEWNSAGGGNPVKDIQKAVDAVRGGRNPTKLIGYCSVNVFRVLSRQVRSVSLSAVAVPRIVAKVTAHG